MQLPAPNSLAAIHWTLIWGSVWVVPWALRASASPPPALRSLVGSAALLMLASGLWPQGFLLPSALAWMLTCLSLAGWGLWRFGQRPHFCAAETLLDAGLLYSTVSGTWYLAFALWRGLMGFDPTMTLLTAVHFCYVTLGAMPWGACVGRRLPVEHAGFRALVAGYLISPALVAAGITASHWSGRATGLEVIGVSLQVLTTTGVTLLALSRLRLSLWLWISGACSLLTMTLALNYAWGRWLGWPHLDLSTMVPYHGLVNALGFVSLGLWAWQGQPGPAAWTPPGLPFQRVGGGWPIGPDYFARTTRLGSPPEGLLDDLCELNSPDFRSQEVYPAIQAFYVNTARHRMQVVADWPLLWRPLAQLYARLSRAMGQMNFPTRPDEAPIRSQMLGLPHNARGWVRSYQHSGQAIYCASYTMFRWLGRGFMNVAFPLPLGNLTSLLWARNLPGGGLTLSSFSASDRPSGVFWVLGGRGWRLPLNEEIEVYFESGAARARHRTWLFGLTCLTLHYEMQPE